MAADSKWLVTCNSLMHYFRPMDCAFSSCDRCMMMAPPYCRRLLEVACATIVRSLSTIQSDLPPASHYLILYGQDSSPSGHLQCPEIPRIQYHLLRVVQDRTPILLMLTYGISLQWLGL